MQSSSFEKAIEAQFDCLTKKVIKYTQKKYYRDISRRWRNQLSFSDLSEMELNHFGILDDYSSNYTAFNVLGMEVQVSDEQLSKALEVLPEKKRNIILLSYFMDMPDLEIGKLMNLVRSTIYRHRTSALKEIKKCTRRTQNMKKNKQLSFDIIVAAADGDKGAIKKALNFYDGYISKLSLRKMYDDYGNVYMVVDSELKGRIQTAVMNMILNFEITVV